MSGSSLPVQGQLNIHGIGDVLAGFIPAGAGATDDRTTGHALARVHPCRCRGNAAIPWNMRPTVGSSLPVQGQRLPRVR